MLNEGGGVLERVGGEAAAVDATFDFALEQAGGFEDAEMLGDGRQGHLEGSGKGLDRGFALGEASEDGAARGVGESAEGGIESGVRRGRGIVNHMVYYCRGPAVCQPVFFVSSQSLRSSTILRIASASL